MIRTLSSGVPILAFQPIVDLGSRPFSQANTFRSMDGEQLNGSLENMTEDQAIAAQSAREELERQAEANIEAA